ncbi:MAG: DNA repair protein RecN, partial [Desulfobacteraceae bacterium]|nr:DNA repair protein RecN [Desulfobacteraceae bacterium]
IKNFAIIDDIRIQFKDGLTVLTGETGAGKSIIIEAVNLILGSRASHDLIRTGHENAELEAFFDVDPESDQAKLMNDQGIDPLEGLMIRRIISSTGRHKVFINSRQSSMQLLKDLTENLAGISSQHAHQGLLKEKNHLDILDRFANTFSLRKEVSIIYNELIVLIRELKALTIDEDKSIQESEFLQFQIDEIKQANIQENEDIELEKTKMHLKNAGQIFEAVNFGANELYSSEGSIIERLSAIKSQIERYKEVDSMLEQKAQVIGSLLFDLEDIASEFSTYSSKINLDPGELEKTENRLDLIQKLKRKYGGSLESIFLQYNEMKDQFSKIGNVKERIAQTKEKIKSLQAKYAKKATLLSDKRKEKAKELSSHVVNELNELEMNQAQFVINFKKTDHDSQNDTFAISGAKAFSTGLDNVSFYISPNPGEKPKPLIKIASGGELSRIILALKIILSRTESLETLVFDEVDAGIGGATSEKVGIKLADLAKTNQVISITHLAQIAKYGTSHFKILKSVSNEKTSTSIIPLINNDDKAKELARMIGGSKITKATLDHAREMLNLVAN